MAALLSDDAGQVSFHHLLHQFAEGGAGLPSEDPLCLRGVAQQSSQLGGAEVLWVDSDEGGTRRGVDRHLVSARSAPLDAAADMAERALDKIAHRMRFTGGKDKVVGMVLLKHQQQ